MSTKISLTVATLIVVLFAQAAYATNGYMSHGYGITSKGMAGAGMALPQDTTTRNWNYSAPSGNTRRTTTSPDQLFP